MDTIEAIITRRSIRRFKEDKVTHETVEKIIKVASFSPSWKNTQITRYIAVENVEIKNRIALEFVPGFNQQAILTAPVLLAVSVIKNRSGYERDGSFSTPKGSGWQMFDCGIASQTVCLAAHSMGLGTVIMGIFDEDKIAELLNIPNEQELIALIAVGYPDIQPEPPKRKPVSDLLKYV